MITEHLRQTVMSPMRQILKLEPTASECWKPGCSLRARGQLLCPWRGPQGGIHTCYTSGATSHFYSGQPFASSFFHDLLEHTKKNTILIKDLKKNYLQNYFLKYTKRWHFCISIFCVCHFLNSLVNLV